MKYDSIVSFLIYLMSFNLSSPTPHIWSYFLLGTNFIHPPGDFLPDLQQWSA